MGIIDFLKPPKKGAPASQIADMQASLERVRAELQASNAIVESHGQRRADLLLSDATSAEIAKLDADVNLAQIDVERLELVEMELVDRIACVRDGDQRARRAGELEAAADAIEQRAVDLEKAVDALAVAFTAFAEAVPVKSPARRPRPGTISKATGYLRSDWPEGDRR